MSIQPISTLFNYKDTEINIDQLPRTSDLAIRVFSDLGHQAPLSIKPIPPAFKGEKLKKAKFSGFCFGQLPPQYETVITGKNLGERIQILSTTIQKLQQAQKDSTKDKIIALIKVIVLVAISVASVLLLPSIGILVSLLGCMFFGMIHEVLLHEEHLENGNLANFRPIDYRDVPYPMEADTDRAMPYLVGGVLLAPIVPIYQAFSRESSLKKVVETQRNRIQQIKDTEIQGFHDSLAYYRDHGDQLSQKIEERIRDLTSAQEKITAFRDQHQIPVTGIGIEQELAALRAAKEELTSACSFYAQFV